VSFLTAFLVVLGVCVLLLARGAQKAGKRQLRSEEMAWARTLLAVSQESPGDGWQRLGSLTSSNGLNLKFDHNDDPQAEAMIFAPGASDDTTRSRLSNRVTIELPEEFTTFHVHTAGYVFRVRAKGTGGVVGKEICLKMAVNPRTLEPVGGIIENDDDTDAAVGDWIEIESAEILQIPQ
jgi:hypothetical protein